MNEQLEKTLAELWGSLTDAQKEKARACTTFGELMQVAGEEGIELPDEFLTEASGGRVFHNAEGKWEVINDSDAHVMAIADTYEAAAAKAVELGQSPDLAEWEWIKYTRNPRICQ